MDYFPSCGYNREVVAHNMHTTTYYRLVLSCVAAMQETDISMDKVSL